MGKNNKRYDYEYVKSKFEEKDYTLVSEEYKNKNEKLDYICNKHKEFGIQKVSFASLELNNCNCKKCISENSKGKHHNYLKHTIKNYDMYFEKYKNKLFDEVGEEYSLEKINVENKRTILYLTHNECNQSYPTDQYKFFKEKCRCQNPKCKFERKSLQRRRDNNDVLNQIYNLVQDEYSVLSEYKGSNEYMNFKHNKCKHEFPMTPHNFIFNEQRCPRCAQLIIKEKLTKPHEIFLRELEEKYPNEYEVLDKYINANTKIRFLHKSCGHITSQTPSKAMLNLSICKFCDHPTRGEQKIIDFLDSIMFGEYEYQQYYDGLIGVNGGELSYDFYIPKYNLLIEYQGEYHDGSVSCQTEEDIERQQEHDRRKREYAKSHGIDLLEIWYWDFDNIENILADYLNLHNENVC